MPAVSARRRLRPVHPLHGIFLAFPFPLFLATLFSDLAYWQTYHQQWANFASWLNAGAMVGATLVLIWALINLFRDELGGGRPIVYFAVLLAMWVLGFINAFIHAKDAWATMPEALILTAIVTVLALIASWMGYTGFHATEELP